MNNGLIENYGTFAPRTEGSGTYPIRATTVLFSASAIWGGYVHDGFEDGQIRMTGGHYNSGMVPGAIVAPGYGQDWNAPEARVYRIRADYATADLQSDAADLFMKPVDQVSDADVAQLRAQYAKDWREWPWQLGAPFYDSNGNGVRDQNEAPGLAGADMVLWYAMNDLDPVAASQLYSAPPTGMEVQTTLWAYKAERHVLANSVFERNRLIYKGTTRSLPDSHIDTMYITRFADTDLGSSGDDLLGSDSVLELGYTYNGNSLDRVFNAQGIRIPPAVGYALLQGPLVAGSDGDSAVFDLRRRAGYRNLHASSMMAKFTGTAWADPPFGREGGIGMYHWMQGFLPLGSGVPRFSFLNPDGTPTKWSFSGDPKTKSGAIDGLGTSEWSNVAAERRFLLSTGPFTMALGDTQEVVYALVGADGGDRLGNIDYLKWFVRYLRSYYPDLAELKMFGESPPAEEPSIPFAFHLEQNFPNPFNPLTTIAYTVAGIKDGDAELSRVRLSVYDMLGREAAELVNERQAPGDYVVTFNASGLASGAYFYRLQAGRHMDTKKMLHLK
jgi:hypothetical protein